jgi:hypothetical protein
MSMDGVEGDAGDAAAGGDAEVGRPPLQTDECGAGQGMLSLCALFSLS